MEDGMQAERPLCMYVVVDRGCLRSSAAGVQDGLEVQILSAMGCKDGAEAI